MIEHTYLFEKLVAHHKSFELMKKHYKAYVNNFDGAKEIRTELMENAKTAADVETIILKHFPKVHLRG
jgi:tRNA-dihydrouridine synthase